MDEDYIEAEIKRLEAETKALRRERQRRRDNAERVETVARAAERRAKVGIILSMIEAGKSNEEIAAVTGLASATIRNYRRYS